MIDINKIKKLIINKTCILQKTNICKNNKKVLLGKGFSLKDYKKKDFLNIELLDRNRKGHLVCFGTTGSGKSRLAENLIYQDIINNKSVVVVDPKMDNSLLSRTYQACMESNRIKDFMLLSSAYPDLSVKINPLSSYFIIDEIIGHIVASVPAKDDFFYNIALETTTAIVHSKLLLKAYVGDCEPLNFFDIYKYVSYEGLTNLSNALERIDSKDSRTVSIKTLIANVLSSPIDYFAKVTSTLRTTLSQMTIGTIGMIIGSATSNKFIEKLEKDEGVVLYIQTPSMLAKKNSDTLCKVVISMLQSCIGRKALKDEVFKEGLSVYIDEASNVLYMGIENMFNKSRSTNTMITALTQNYADFIDAVGQEKAKMILGNANAKIFLRLVDVDTAYNASLYGGEIIKWDNMISTGSIMSKQNKESMLNSENFLTLEPREFYYFGMEGNYKGKTVKMEDPEIKIITPEEKSDNY